MSFGINSRHTKEEHSEKPSHTFPEHTHTKHQPAAGPSASSDHWTPTSESTDRGHQDSEHRLNTINDGWPEEVPMGSAPGSKEGHDGKGHALGQRSPWSE